MAVDVEAAGSDMVLPRRRVDEPRAQLFKATAPVIALGLLAVVAVLLVASDHEFAVSVRAQAGSWASEHPPIRLDGISARFSTKKPAMNIVKGTKLDWGGSEEFMADDAAKIASNQANIFEPKYGQTPPPINRGYLIETEQAQGEQTQETIDNAALAAGEEIKGKSYYTNETFVRDGPADNVYDAYYN